MPGADSGDRLAFPVAEFFGDQIDGCLDINVTTDEYAHVVRHIVGVKVVLDIYQRGIFQVLNGPDCRLLSIGVHFVEQFVHGSPYNPAAIVESPVFLLVNGFQFCVEQSEDGIYKSVCFNFGPLC